MHSSHTNSRLPSLEYAQGLLGGERKRSIEILSDFPNKRLTIAPKSQKNRTNAHRTKLMERTSEIQAHLAPARKLSKPRRRRSDVSSTSSIAPSQSDIAATSRYDALEEGRLGQNFSRARVPTPDVIGIGRRTLFARRVKGEREASSHDALVSIFPRASPQI